MKFQGKTIVITGASSGIGKALAARSHRIVDPAGAGHYDSGSGRP
jgi:NAD(P)-dependent dehydrogenase (short-subunit alcohol dehydrogenase family)